MQGSVSLHCQPVYVLDSKRNVRRLAQSVTCRTRPLHFYVTCMKHSPLSLYVFLFMCLLLVILSRSKSFISCIISNTNSDSTDMYTLRDDDDCRASCPRMSVDILGTNCDQCMSMVQCCFTSTETVRLVRTESPGRPPQLSHSS